MPKKWSELMQKDPPCKGVFSCKIISGLPSIERVWLWGFQLICIINTCLTDPCDPQLHNALFQKCNLINKIRENLSRRWKMMHKCSPPTQCCKHASLQKLFRLIWCHIFHLNNDHKLWINFSLKLIWLMLGLQLEVWKVIKEMNSTPGDFNARWVTGFGNLLE